MNTEHTPGPWRVGNGSFVISDHPAPGIIGSDDVHHYGGHLICESVSQANARLIAAAPDLLAALKMARLAIGEHYAPHDCYATGPLTGDHYLDLVACPACAFIKLHDAAIAKAEGKA